jgi:hypothetical protein
MGALLALKPGMLEITHSTPGRRFQERYRKKQGDSA